MNKGKITNFVLNIILIILLFSCTAFGNNEDLPDLALIAVEKSHSEVITESPHIWEIIVNSETPIENESIMIEVLHGKVQNPTLKSSGNTDFSSLKAIVESLVSPEMSNEEKSLALWRFVMDNTYVGLWGTSGDALEHLNVYGYGYCGTFATVLEALWWAAGLKARHVNTGNHAATEVYYDNDWHYIDAHLRRFFLEKDNKTIASLEDLNRIPELWNMKRLSKYSHKGIKKEYYMTMHPEGHGRSPVYSMDFSMAKGDVLTLTWQKEGKWCLTRGAEGGDKPAPEPAIYANGISHFRRDLSNLDQSKEGLVFSKNINWTDFADGYLHPARLHEEASIVYSIGVSYFIPSITVSGKFQRKNSDDLIALDISTDNGQNWINLWEATETGIINAKLITDQTQKVTTDKPWKYSYLLRIRMRAEKSIHDVRGYLLESVSDLFYNPKSLPNLKNGENMITFNNEGSLPQSIKLTYKWRENLPIRISKEFPLEGEKVTLSAVVNNNGKEEANSIVVAFYLGDPRQGGIEISRDNVKKISPGKWEYARVPWEATRKLKNKGHKTRGAEIYVIVDPDNVVNESDEYNNSFSRTITVLNPPYVSIPSENFVKFTRKKDNPEILSITATVRNFSSSVNYGFYISDHAEAERIVIKFFDGEPQKGKQIGKDQAIESLKPLEFKNVSVDWDISKLNRQHKIYVQVFTPENVINALGPKKTEKISTTIDLDLLRECMADRF